MAVKPSLCGVFASTAPSAMIVTCASVRSLILTSGPAFLPKTRTRHTRHPHTTHTTPTHDTHDTHTAHMTQVLLICIPFATSVLRQKVAACASQRHAQNRPQVRGD